MHFLDTLHNFGQINYLTFPIMVLLLIGLALVFDFLNGLHDSANSIATVVSTRVLSPRTAVIWAAFFNFVAFLLFHLKVANTIGKGIIDPAIVNNSVIAGTLIGACAWNILTWYWGLPTSSSHALIGGLVGAGLAHSGIGALVWGGILYTCLFIILAPFVGLISGLAIAVAVHWIFRRARPRFVDSFFRRGQLLSAAFYSLGHGGNDAQKTMGIIFVLLLAATQTNSSLEWHNRFQITEESVAKLRTEKDHPADDVLARLGALEPATFANEKSLATAVLEQKVLTPDEWTRYRTAILKAVDHAEVPTEIVLACHLAMGIGTLMGGWRIVKTMGQRIIRLRPVDGFCAETGAAFTLVMTIFAGVPVSTTQTITGSLVGVGALQRLSAVRWGVAGRVVWAWIFTIPGAALVSAASYGIIEMGARWLEY